MKDEIKEILSKDNIHIIECEGNWCNAYGYEKSQLKEDLLDYITNLQEEIHKKEAMYDSLAVDYRLSQEENERLLKTQEMYEKKCNKIHQYITQNCEIIRHKDCDEIGKVNGGHILFLLNGDDE